MPPIFKALSTIIAWILFVFGCLALLGGFGRIVVYALNMSGGWQSGRLIGAYFFMGILSLILSAVAMKIRKSLE